MFFSWQRIMNTKSMTSCYQVKNSREVCPTGLGAVQKWRHSSAVRNHVSSVHLGGNCVKTIANCSTISTTIIHLFIKLETFFVSFVTADVKTLVLWGNILVVCTWKRYSVHSLWNASCINIHSHFIRGPHGPICMSLALVYLKPLTVV